MFKINPDGTGFSVLRSFDGFVEGYPSESALVQGPDGSFYGTTSSGGSGECGSVFKINADGSGFNVLKVFDVTLDGGFPLSPLVVSGDGALYGTTSLGGEIDGGGTVFSIDPHTGDFEVIKRFRYGSQEEGYSPTGLMRAADGALYGTTSFGGDLDLGTVFRILFVNTPVGADVVVSPGNGVTVTFASVVLPGDTFATVTNAGPAIPAGFSLGNPPMYFEITTTAAFTPPVTVCFNFDPAQFNNPANVRLLHCENSQWIDVTTSVDVENHKVYGTVNSLSLFAIVELSNHPPVANAGPDQVVWAAQDGQATVTLNGSASTDPDGDALTYTWTTPYETISGAIVTVTMPVSDGYHEVMLTVSDGKGGTASDWVLIEALEPTAPVFERLKSFGAAGDMANPYAGLTQGADGAFYGTTVYGGSFDEGAVFKINPDGTGYLVLKEFYDSDGGYPYASLVQGADGALYGTTTTGSTFAGTVFKLNPDGTGFTVLKEFGGSDGAEPYGNLVQGPGGILYGTTVSGGSHGWGTVFKINPDGTGFAVLREFNGDDGGNPYAGLLLANDGALYGTTSSGNSSAGTVFKINPDGTGFSVLVDLSATDSWSPYSGLVQGTDGALYGTSSNGSGDSGTVFKLNRDGSGYTLLHTWIPGEEDRPYASLIQGPDGTLYGTTYTGGQWYGAGIVFEINPDGSGFKVLKQFDGEREGANPAAILIWGRDGGLYGTTFAGGDLGQGTVFRLFLINTPIGGDVVVSPSSDIALGFSSITAPGNTVVTTSDTGPEVPAGFSLGDPPVYYDISTTATFTPPVIVSISFDPARFTDPANVRLLHNENNQWVDVTSSVDVPNHTVYGTVNGLSPFAIVEPSNRPPVANAGPDPVVSAGQDCQAMVTLDGSASSDPDGDALTFTWAGPFGTATGATPTVTLSSGEHTITLTVSDGKGGTASDTVIITVRDTTAPVLACPANITIACSTDPLVPVTFSVTATDNCDPAPTVTCSPPSGSGFPVGTTTVTCTATDASGNQANGSFTVTRLPLGFTGFLSPIAGADGTGGSFANPIRTFKLKSTIPVKFTASCNGNPVITGIHRLQVIKYTDETTADDPIDATPQDAATTGNEFRLTGGEWHFNLDAQATGMSVGKWLFVATLSDGSQHSVWIQIK